MISLEQFSIRALLGAAAIAVCTTGVAAQEFGKNIMTGGPTGTYIQFGNDIADLMAECGQTLNVSQSAGSLENFLGVRQRPNTQFGIVQSDVLEYLQTYSANDPVIARAIAGVRIAFPLYNEEVHIMARKDIADLAGLTGKRVAVGVEDSGTFLTSSLILDLAEVGVAERVTIGPDDSLRQLQAGEIDAFFYVAGAPTSLFGNANIDPDQFHLLPINDPVLQTVYTPTEIPAGTYSFQTDALEAVAVKAVLMTFEYNPRRNSYHRSSCTAVADVANQIFTNFAELQEGGHPKWNQVDLTDIPPGWDISSCVNDGLAASYEVSSCEVPVLPAASADESSANQAYRQRICEQLGC